MRAVESGPPDTASTSTGKVCRLKKRAFASDAETTPVSAVRTLLFLLNAALHAGRSPRIFPSDFRKRGAGRFFLVHRGERLAKTQQGVGGLAGALELGRNAQERFRGIAVALLLEQAFTEPILGLGHQALVRIFLEKITE